MLAAIFTYLRFSVLEKVNTYKLFIPPLSAAIFTQSGLLVLGKVNTYNLFDPPLLAATFTQSGLSVLKKADTHGLFIPLLLTSISTQPRLIELEATTYTILTGQFSQLFEVRNVWALKYRVTRYIWGLWAIDRRSQYSTESHCEHEPGRLHFDFDIGTEYVICYSYSTVSKRPLQNR
jgi:hypothetical protein